jgi:hypothetical protein
MTRTSHDRPVRADIVTTYAELQQFVSAFANGKLNTVIIIGAPGLQKSRIVADTLGTHAHFIRGQTTAYGLYRDLYLHRNAPLVLDDLDCLFADRAAVRLLKCLLETNPVKTVSWQSRATQQDGLPSGFQTRSNVIIITNAWKTLNAHVSALEDRAHVLVFQPTPIEVHLRVGTWYWDQEIFDFIGSHLSLIKRPSMREYVLAWDRKRAGLPWRYFLLGRWLSGKQLLVAQLRADSRFATEADRVAVFIARASASRATYYNVLKKLPPLVEPPQVTLNNREPSDGPDVVIDLPGLLRKRHGRLGNG